MISRQFPAENPCGNLAAQALANGNADQLWRVYTSWSQAAPADPQVQAEYLMIGLLIRPFEPGFATRAADLIRQYPANAVCRMAQALALWRANRSVEAAALLDRQNIPFADEPRFALIRGLILSSVGRSAESEKMFAIAAAAKLLPAEQSLLKQAADRNRSGPAGSKSP